MRPGYREGVNSSVLLVSAAVSVIAVLAWIGLLVWGAVEDGRAQREHYKSK